MDYYDVPDLDDYEYLQDASLGLFGDDGWDSIPSEEYDPTPLDEAYSEGDETFEMFFQFWMGSTEKDIDPRVYRGTKLDWHTLEQYRALNPRVQ